MKRWLAALCLGLLGISGAGAELIDEFESDATGGLNASMPSGSINLKQVQRAFDEARIDENVLTVRYDRREAPRVRLREYMATLIVLPDSERIEGYSLGDSQNFTFVPMDEPHGNMGRVQAQYPGADTNLALIGESGRIFPFYLRVDSVESEHMPAFVVYVEDQVPNGVGLARAERANNSELREASADAEHVAEREPERSNGKEGEYLRELEDVDVTSVQCSYETSGGRWFRRNAKWFGRSVNHGLEPLRICDDGRWTYFRLGEGDLEGLEELPVVYQVVDGYDTPVNTRIQDGVLIAETTAERWTLRAGERHLCVRRR